MSEKVSNFIIACPSSFCTLWFGHIPEGALRTPEKWISSSENGWNASTQQEENAEEKDGERHLHFPSCTPDVQAALIETRRTEWNKWMKFNAGVILTDEEV